MAFSQNLVTVLDRRAKVKKWILEPLAGRGLPPKGWSEEAWFSDALEQLDYPEPVLERAARNVRADHTRSSWPMPSEFRQACEKLMADEPTPSSISYAEAGPRSAEAWDYVRRRLLAGDLGLRQFTERGAGEIGKYLFERACACLRAGEEPHVSDADVEQYIVEQEAWCLKRYGPVEKYSTPVGSLGQTAKGIVDRLRPTTAYVDQAVIERVKNIEPPDEELDP